MFVRWWDAGMIVMTLFPNPSRHGLRALTTFEKWQSPASPRAHMRKNSMLTSPFCPYFKSLLSNSLCMCQWVQKHNAPSGKDCPKQCGVFVWFMSHPWLLAFATVARPLNSNVWASGPTCCHPRLSNTDGTLSKPHSSSCRCMRRPPAPVPAREGKRQQ